MTPDPDTYMPWEMHKLRVAVLREQYVNGDMDEGVLRARLKLIGYAEPFLTAEVDYCEGLKNSGAAQ